MRIWLATAVLTASLLLFGTQVRAQPSLSSGTIVAAAERLQPGEYLWAAEIAPEGPVMVVISLATQRVVAYRNGIPIGISTVSTGRPGYRTPAGVFTILQKRVDHRSSTYDNAPMPYMQRLTWRGVALHAGNLPGHPASHGCIRLPNEFARLLYSVTRVGTTVVITNETAVPRIAPLPVTAASNTEYQVGSSHADPIWNPEASPAGPVTIVVSGADRRVVVLRNGRIIGSAPLAFDGEIDEAAAFILQSIDASGRHWRRLPLPGQTVSPTTAVPWAQRFGAPEAFRSAVVSALRPGATVVITPDSLHPGAARRNSP